MPSRFALTLYEVSTWIIPLIVAIRERVKKAQHHHNAPRQLERLEVDLHGEVVLSCANRQLRDAIQRNALPLFATHSTFALIQDDEEIETMLPSTIRSIISCSRGRGRRRWRRLTPTSAARSNPTSTV
jgi:hypothetical protein